MKSIRFPFSSGKKVTDASALDAKRNSSSKPDAISTLQEGQWAWSSRYLESASSDSANDYNQEFQFHSPRQLSVKLSAEDSFEYESLTNFCPIPNVTLPTDVVIAVQASTISSLEIKVGRTLDENKNVILDGSSGHAVVGVVKEIGAKVYHHGIQVGDRVAAITKSIIGNIRYAKVKVDVVVKVPCGTESAEAACAAYTYLVAFQSLHHGRSALQRYSNKAFQSKRILVLDGMNTYGRALIELSHLLGAAEVYATSNQTNHNILASLGALPLNNHAKDWLPVVEGKMDIVIVSVLNSNFNYDKAKRALKEKGKIVCIGSPMTLKGVQQGKVKWASIYEQVRAQVNLIFSRNVDATYYELFCNLDNYRAQLKSDLSHIFHLLDHQKINPTVAKYVTADDVSYGLSTMDPSQMTAGTIICEPWRRKGPPKAEKDLLHLYSPTNVAHFK